MIPGQDKEEDTVQNIKKEQNEDMKLSELLKNVSPIAIHGNTDVEIKGVNIDSRRIEDGHLFVAMRGTQVDGHRFIGKAVAQGR